MTRKVYLPAPTSIFISDCLATISISLVFFNSLAATGVIEHAMANRYEPSRSGFLMLLFLISIPLADERSAFWRVERKVIAASTYRVCSRFNSSRQRIRVVPVSRVFDIEVGTIIVNGLDAREFPGGSSHPGHGSSAHIPEPLLSTTDCLTKQNIISTKKTWI